MTRLRKPPPDPLRAAGISSTLFDLLKEKLEQDSLDFACGTTDEDPKRYALRLAAAREALEFLGRLATLAGVIEPTAEPTEAETLAEARDAIAHENKS
jgi:hypothetical protein